jgi:hypothetical protein
VTLSRHEQLALVRPGDPDADRYKGRWSTLSNTTLGMLMAIIDASIVLISLPDIFRGIQLNPLTPGNTSYFLWMLMGYRQPQAGAGPHDGDDGHDRPP